MSTSPKKAGTKNSRQSLGQWGEETAAAYLQERGYTLLARNLHFAHGEIDIVAEKEGCIIFVEVKARSSNTYSYPEASVNRRKQAFLLSSVETYLEQHPERPDTWQFDVIAITGGPGKKVQIEHFENVLG